MIESSYPAATVSRPELRAGPLVAEGGEGRVYELVDRPGVLYKAYRHPMPAGPLDALIAWERRAAGTRPQLARRVLASAAWPASVVTEPGAPEGTVSGILLPRAPRRFSLRHRDGTSRLATLSYLTADPAQRAAAYGLSLPPPVSVERLGVVYALARLLEAFQSADPAIGHGDLSTKNVLWSLERGPEVFVLDCDSCERYHPDGSVVDDHGRARAMTPNWDDPAIPAGGNPTLASDRYSLALIFLRVVGAAHFPIQRRQREGGSVGIDLGLPPAARRARSLREGAVIWELCARCLGVGDPGSRPGAGAWVSALEEVLDELGGMSQVRAVWAAQGGGEPAATPQVASTPVPTEVNVRPVPASGVTRRWERSSAVSARAVTRGHGPVRAAGTSVVPGPVARGTWRGSVPGPPGPSSAAGPVGQTAQPPPGILELFVTGSRRGGQLWLVTHRDAVAALLAPARRREGVWRGAGCLVLDFVLLAVGFYVVAMIVSVFSGI